MRRAQSIDQSMSSQTTSAIQNARRRSEPSAAHIGSFAHKPEESSIPTIVNELDYAKWYDTAGTELLEATYEKYRYVSGYILIESRC